LKENFDRFNSQIYKEKEMADFRRCILSFAVVALLFGLIPTASAQNQQAFQCIANAATPPTLRSEGLTELVGDIALNCTGGTPTPTGSVFPQANFTIFLNTQVTSRLLSNSPGSEAELLIDDPQPAGNASPVPQELVCVPNSTLNPNFTAAIAGFQTNNNTCPVAGTAAAGANGNPLKFKPFGFTDPRFPGAVGEGNTNIFQGIVSGNSVTFIGIPIDPPGTTGSRLFRFTNIRANATIPAPGASGTPGSIVALISATPAISPSNPSLTANLTINNPSQIVGFVQTSLTTSVLAGRTGNTVASAGAIQILQCVGANVAGAPGNVLHLRYSELFATAFKTRTAATYIDRNTSPPPASQPVPGTLYDSESGLYITTVANGANSPLISNVPPAGLADFGTRLKAVFNNIPNGVSVFVGVNNNNLVEPIKFVVSGTVSTFQGPPVGTVARLTASETGPFSAVASNNTTFSDAGVGGAFQIPIVNGSGSAVWEVLASDPLANQNYDFSVWFVATPSPSTNSPAVGTGTVNLSYAPVPPSFTASAGAVASSSLPIPRFIDTSTASNIVAVTICQTSLLYPYVVNVAGFDTGLAIANTSTDPFGTAAQVGPCTLNFYGSNAPAAVTTASIASGTVYSNLASTLAPNFAGYMIAVCNFQYAHGFAFISDVGARNLAMGYLALIIPGPGRGNGASPFDLAGFNSGEQLGY